MEEAEPTEPEDEETKARRERFARFWNAVTHNDTETITALGAEFIHEQNPKEVRRRGTRMRE